MYSTKNLHVFRKKDRRGDEDLKHPQEFPSPSSPMTCCSFIQNKRRCHSNSIIRLLSLSSRQTIFDIGLPNTLKSQPPPSPTFSPLA